ncbi:MAG: restriction endonuclease subunit S [Clostridium sp.]
MENKIWKPFTMSYLFDITSTNSGIDKSKLINKQGRIPYLTRSEKNNGLDCFVGKQIDKYNLNQGNVITIGLDTQTVFYQASEFYTGQNIQILYNEKLNKNIALFIIPIIKSLLKKFNWGGNGATLTRLKRSKIILPVNKVNQPDWAFMENYTELQKNITCECYKKYIQKNLKDIEYKDIKKIGEKEWKAFIVKDLFDSKIGKSIDGNKVDKQNGRTPYITRKESNNGLDGLIDYNKEYLYEGSPVITIGNETAQPFVQSYDFFTGTKVNILKPKDPISKYALLFICQCLYQNKNKYSYSFTINSTRLKKQILLLPVKESIYPDYEYMEQYIKNIVYKQLKDYI